MSGRDVRARPFFRALRKRLASPLMLDILGKPGRVYLAGDPVPDKEDQDGKPWSRIILLSPVALYPVADMPGQGRVLPFIVKAETAAFEAAGYDPGISLDAIQAEAYNRLDAWSPGTVTDGSVSVLVSLPVYRYQSPNPLPLFDDSRNIWAMSAEYRVELRSA